MRRNLLPLGYAKQATEYLTAVPKTKHETSVTSAPRFDQRSLIQLFRRTLSGRGIDIHPGVLTTIEKVTSCLLRLLVLCHLSSLLQLFDGIAAHTDVP